MAKIVIPTLDLIDEAARRGEPLDARAITQLTGIIRRLTELISDAGGAGLIAATVAEGNHDDANDL